MKIESFEKYNEAPKEKIYSFDEVKQTEGIFSPIGYIHDKSGRLITIKNSNAVFVTIYFSSQTGEISSIGDWRGFNFIKTNEKIYMSVK